MSQIVVPSHEDVLSTMNSAMSQGHVSAAAGSILLESLDPIALGGCGGLGIDDIDSEEATLVACVIDASYSMESHRQEVVDAYNNQFLAPLRGTKNANDILVTTWIFNTSGCNLLHGYTPVKDCPDLSNSTYTPNGGTPLYDAVSKALQGIVTYGQTLRNGGTRTKCIVVVLSDGEENASSQSSAYSVKTVAKDLLKQEIYVLSYGFFGAESEGDAIAAEIGFPANHRITGKQTSSDIRRIFGTVSASVISASQQTISSQSLSANPFFVSQ